MNAPIQSSEARATALDSAIKALEKQYGNGSVMRIGSGPRVAIDTIPSGSLGLDLAIGVGGYPRGRVVEIYGPESSGKTTLALHAIANCQAAGGTAAFVDAEHALEPSYAEKLGVEIERLLIAQPDDGEQALDITEGLASSGAVDLIVIDSVAALVPRSELAGDMGDHHVGTQARLMSQALRKLTGIAHRQGVCILFINQLRQKIGVSFGPNEVTTGGNALKFYASLRLDVRRIGAVKDGDVAVGNKTRVKVVKNKLAPPFKVVEFDIMFGRGISAEGELLDLGDSASVLSKSGSWYAIGETKLGNGRETAKKALEESPALKEELRQLILAANGLAASTADEADEA